LKVFTRDPLGLAGRTTRTVDATMTASAVGSGAVDVLSTPTMVLLMEMAAVEAVSGALADGCETVGVQVNVRHSAATSMGDTVTATATVTAVEGRTLTYTVEARDTGKIIGTGTHTRVAVDLQRFLASLRTGE
jgi:predicted thioesterase